MASQERLSGPTRGGGGWGGVALRAKTRGRADPSIFDKQKHPNGGRRAKIMRKMAPKQKRNS